MLLFTLWSVLMLLGFNLRGAGAEEAWAAVDLGGGAGPPRHEAVTWAVGTAGDISHLLDCHAGCKPCINATSIPAPEIVRADL